MSLDKQKKNTEKKKTGYIRAAAVGLTIASQQPAIADGKQEIQPVHELTETSRVVTPRELGLPDLGTPGYDHDGPMEIFPPIPGSPRKEPPPLELPSTRPDDLPPTPVPNFRNEPEKDGPMS